MNNSHEIKLIDCQLGKLTTPARVAGFTLDLLRAAGFDDAEAFGRWLDEQSPGRYAWRAPAGGDVVQVRLRN